MAVIAGSGAGNDSFISRLPQADQQAIKQGNVESAQQAAHFIAGDSRMLATVLQGDGLTQGAENELIHELINGADPQSGMAAIYGDVDNLPPEQQRVIAEAIDTAFRDGVIDEADLLALSDFSTAGNGAQRIISILDDAPQAAQSGGSIEALGEALLDRANGDPNSEQGTLDYFGAAVAFSQGRDIYARNRGTDAERLAMFEATVEVNKTLADGVGVGDQTAAWEREGLAVAGRLFADSATMITDHFTGAGVDSAPLAEFFGQTVFNPDAQHIALDNRRDLVPSINNALEYLAEGFVSDAENATTQLGRETAFDQLGVLAAAVSGGAVVSLDNYSDEIAANEAFRDEMAGILNTTITPFFKALPGPASSVAGNASKDLVASVIGRFIDNPERPDVAFANEFGNALEIGVREFEVQNGFDGLTSAFKASRSNELLSILLELNLNTGGYR